MRDRRAAAMLKFGNRSGGILEKSGVAKMFCMCAIDQARRMTSVLDFMINFCFSKTGAVK